LNCTGLSGEKFFQEEKTGKDCGSDDWLPYDNPVQHLVSSLQYKPHKTKFAICIFILLCFRITSSTLLKSLHLAKLKA
jgi:hypothetical protein